VASPLPSASRMFIIRAGEEGKPSWCPAFRMGWRPASSSSIQGRRAFTSLTEEANCHLLPGRCVAVRPPYGRRSRRVQVGHVHGPSHAAGYTGGSYKTSYSAGAVSAFLDSLVLAPVARTGVRTSLVHAGEAAIRRYGVGAQVAAVVGAEVVAATGEASHCRGGCLHRRDRQCHLWPDLRLFGFNGLFSPLVGGRGRGPFHSSICPGAIAAAV
jgi:hypothetical protein